MEGLHTMHSTCVDRRVNGMAVQLTGPPGDLLQRIPTESRPLHFCTAALVHSCVNAKPPEEQGIQNKQLFGVESPPSAPQ